MLAEAAFGAAVLLGALPLPELSGLAVGERGVWAHEDSGSDPVLSRVDPAGRVLERVRVRAANTDWEDLAAAPDAGGTPSLWVAAGGDNREARAQVQVHRVAEADPGGPVTTHRFRYEDGPHDAEALLVLPGGQRLAVVTKGLGSASVYAGELGAGADGVLRRVAELPLRTTGTPGGPVGAFSGLLVTGASVTADGSRVAVRTYTDLYEWPLQADLAATFAAAPSVSALPATRQGEAVAYARDGASVLVASEGDPAPVHRLARTARPASAGTEPAPTSPPASPQALPPTAPPTAAAPGAPAPTAAERSWQVAAAGLAALSLAVLAAGVRKRTRGR